MTEPEFLEPDVVLFLHDQALDAYGGVPGVKSEALLGSVDLSGLAAAHAFGIAGNHAFNDGNRRTAWSSCVLFPRVNGVGLGVEAPEAVEQVVRPAAGRVDEAGFAAWLRVRAL